MKYLVQIGAGKGEDHVYDIVKQDPNNWFCLLVEPNSYLVKKLENCYKNVPNIFIENKAVTTKNGVVTLYFNDIDGIKSDSEHTSINLNHVLVHGNAPENITEAVVDCFTLITLLEKYGLDKKELNHLFIDVEGHDCDILLSTDFSNLTIKNICFEKLHTDGPFTTGIKFEQTKKHLESFGYTYNGSRDINGWDAVFSKN